MQNYTRRGPEPRRFSKALAASMRKELAVLEGLDEEKRNSETETLIKSWTERRNMMIEACAVADVIGPMRHANRVCESRLENLFRTGRQRRPLIERRNLKRSSKDDTRGWSLLGGLLHFNRSHLSDAPASRKSSSRWALLKLIYH